MSLNYITVYNDDVAAKVQCKLFNCEIDLLVKAGNTEYAEKCLDYFNNLPDEIIDKLKFYSLRYCEDFRQFFDNDAPEVPKNVSEESIFNYVKPRIMVVQEPKNAEKLAFGVELRCEWEREHGMEWVFNDGELLYVGDYVGLSPWYSSERYKRECMNYVYHEHCID